MRLAVFCLILLGCTEPARAEATATEVQETAAESKARQEREAKANAEAIAARAREQERAALFAEFDAAIYKGDVAAIGRLLASVKPEEDRYTQYPLLVASVTNVKVLKFLGSRGVNLRATFTETLIEKGTSHNLLNAAIEFGQPESYAFLRQAGLDFTKECLESECYMQSIVLGSQISFIDTLKREGRALDIEKRSIYRGYETTPLLLAASAERGKVFQWLLQNGANANAANVHGQTPLYHAVWNRDATAADALIARGANARARFGGGGSLLHVLFQRGDHDARLLELLLVHGADVNAQDARGQTALMFLVQHLSRKEPAVCDCTEAEIRRMHKRRMDDGLLAIKMLRAQGARLDLKNSEGKTAVDLASDEVKAFLAW